MTQLHDSNVFVCSYMSVQWLLCILVCDCTAYGLGLCGLSQLRASGTDYKSADFTEGIPCSGLDIMPAPNHEILRCFYTILY